MGFTRLPPRPAIRVSSTRIQRQSGEDSTRLAKDIKDAIEVLLSAVFAFLLVAYLILVRVLRLALGAVAAAGALGLSVLLALIRIAVTAVEVRMEEAKQKAELKRLEEAKQEQQSKAEDKGCTE